MRFAVPTEMEPVAEEDSVAVRTATTPPLIEFWFMPVMRHV